MSMTSTKPGRLRIQEAVRISYHKFICISKVSTFSIITSFLLMSRISKRHTHTYTLLCAVLSSESSVLCYLLVSPLIISRVNFLIQRDERETGNQERFTYNYNYLKFNMKDRIGTESPRGVDSSVIWVEGKWT